MTKHEHEAMEAKASVIVRSTYRYKRPPRKRKAVPLEVPAVVTISDKTRRRVSETADVASDDDREPAIVRAKKPGPRNAGAAPAPELPATPPAHDDRKPAIKIASAELEREPERTSYQRDTKSAIVTARRPGKRRYADVPEMTEEEHKRRGDLADALFQKIKREIAAKPR